MLTMGADTLVTTLNRNIMTLIFFYLCLFLLFVFIYLNEYYNYYTKMKINKLINRKQN